MPQLQGPLDLSVISLGAVNRLTIHNRAQGGFRLQFQIHRAHAATPPVSTTASSLRERAWFDYIRPNACPTAATTPPDYSSHQPVRPRLQGRTPGHTFRANCTKKLLARRIPIPNHSQRSSGPCSLAPNTSADFTLFQVTRLWRWSGVVCKEQLRVSFKSFDFWQAKESAATNGHRAHRRLLAPTPVWVRRSSLYCHAERGSVPSGCTFLPRLTPPSSDYATKVGLPQRTPKNRWQAPERARHHPSNPAVAEEGNSN